MRCTILAVLIDPQKKYKLFIQNQKNTKIIEPLKKKQQKLEIRKFLKTKKSKKYE